MPRAKNSRQTEYAIQKECMKWLRDTYPAIVATATVGGAHLSSGPRGAAKLHAAGYLNGIPDVLIFRPAQGKHALFIEMKRPGAQLRPEQAHVAARLHPLGYACRVAHSLAEFQQCVAEYLGPDAAAPAAAAGP